MTRKRKVHSRQQDPGEEADTSDEDSPAQGSTKGCPHVTKAVNVTSLKKLFKGTTKLGECQGCLSASAVKGASPAEENGTESDPLLDNESQGVWLCLQCGYQGCGRMSTAKHAVVHHQTPHSDPHDVVVNPENWMIWCYKCDDEVGIDSARRLTECVDLVKKNFNQKNKRSLPSSIKSKQAVSLSKVTLEFQPVTKDVSKNIEEQQQKPAQKKPLNGMRPDVSNILKVKGLSNLGNTCFFNAVMQSLNQCRCFIGVLRDHCSSGRKWHIDLTPEQRIKDKQNKPIVEDGLWRSLIEIPRMNIISTQAILLANFEKKQDSVDVSMPGCGPLTEALLKFLEEMEQASQKKNNIVMPAQLFKRVCEKAPQFKGWQQQDSHELLRYLLDAVKTEEIKRQRTGLAQAFGMEKNARKEHLDENTRAAFKALNPVSDFTIIEKVFGGQLVSTVQCEDCHVSSQVFETFMDLSLPVFEEKPSRPGLHKRTNSTEKPEPIEEGEVVYRKGDSSSIKTSKHQEKKNKRQLKRDAKKQGKSMMQKSSLLIEEPDGSIKSDKEVENEDGSKTEYVTDGQSNDGVGSLYRDLEVYVTEADVEDNDETSSHHSQGSSRSQNESDLSSLSPSDTVCASGSTTVESDLTATENLDDSAVQDLCQKVASLDFYNQKSQNRESDMDSTTLANALTSPSSVEIASMDSGIVVSSTDSQNDRTTKRLPQSTHHHRASSRKCSQELLTTSLTPLAPPCKLASQECSVLSCLHQFTIRELLMGNNKFGCENCTRRKVERNGAKYDERTPVVYTNASKQLLISSPPAVLTLQLKRFQQVGRNLMKVNRYVEFPLILDLAPFCSRLVLAHPHVRKGQHQILYSLLAVVEHSGKLTGGHYTAYVKVQPQQPQVSLSPFLNKKLMGEKELQFLLEEVEKKHDSDTSWEMYSDVPNDLLFEKTVTPEVPPGKWFHISDIHVTEVSESTVLRCKAYLLFYERIL